MLAKSLFECAMNLVDEDLMLCASVLDNVCGTDIDDILLRSFFRSRARS
jgi:hypothetical protein